jgi:hypothetical protein
MKRKLNQFTDEFKFKLSRRISKLIKFQSRSEKSITSEAPVYLELDV